MATEMYWTRGTTTLYGGGLRVVLEVHAARTVHFWENYTKPKLYYAPDLEGWVRSDQVPDHTKRPGSQP